LRGRARNGHGEKNCELEEREESSRSSLSPRGAGSGAAARHGAATARRSLPVATAGRRRPDNFHITPWN
jgi:hypothetical protein